MFRKLNSLFIVIFLLYIISYCDFGQSQIVTPDRFNKKDKAHGVIINKTVVEVTDKNLQEAKALRDEINKAVQEDRYHVTFKDTKEFKNSNITVNHSNKTSPIVQGSINSAKLPPSVIVQAIATRDSSDTKEIEEAIGSIFNSNNGSIQSDIENKSKLLISEILGDEIAPNDNERNKTVATKNDLDEAISKDTKSLYNVKDSDIKVNTVQSQLGQSEDDESHQKFFLEDFLPKQFVDREVLTVTSIEEDPKFILGDGVNEWKILRTEDKNYWIGLKSHDILIISNEIYENVTRVDFGYPIVTIETFTYWNTTSDRSTGVILLSIDNSILWIESRSLQLIWNWNIGKKTKIMKFYQIDGREYLAILAVSENSNQYAIHIYEFLEETKEFWIIQVIPLNSETQEMVFLDTGREAILAVTQGNNVLVFDYNPDAEFRYDIAANFTSEDLKSISAFKMGGYSYLAISGRQPQILRYYRGDFVPQTLFGEFFKWVHMYFPIPARTYRDDLILLVQHSMEFEGHSLLVLEALVWNGQSFEATGDIPCILGNETFHFGVSCMIDLERDEGISGAAIIDGGRNISIIVPRQDAPSGVFTIHTILKERKTELQELEDLYKFLNATATEQEEVINATMKLIENPESLVELNLDYFSARELLFGGEIDKININNVDWSIEDENFDIGVLLKDLEDLNEDVKSLEEEIASDLDIRTAESKMIEDCFSTKSRKKRSFNQFDYSNLTLNSVVIDNLIVDSINNETIPKLIQNNTLSFNGTIVFESDLLVTKALNIVENEYREYRELRNDGDVLEAGDLVIDGDVEFEYINGINWKEFLGKVTIKQFPAQFDTLIVEGDVIFDQGLQISTLNGNSFPDGFFWSSGPRTNVVTAKKNFTGNLEANAMDTEGLINGIDPFTLITLSDDQKILKKTVFHQLEVSEQLELNGTVSGRDLLDFLSNPTLLDTHLIHSACQFNVLKVNGNITIAGKFNDKNVDDLLEDIIYKDDPGNLIEIASKKTFHQDIECSDKVQITSKTINDILIDDFVTSDTNQNIKITHIFGDIELENVHLEGHFNSFNVTDMLENTLMLDSNNFLNATLIFEDPVLLKVPNLVVYNKLNDVHCNNLVNIMDPIEIDDLRLENSSADLVDSESDIEGAAFTINGFDLRNLSTSTKAQARVDSQEVNVIDELVVEDNLEVEFLNDYEALKAIQTFEKFYDIPHMVKQGLVILQELIINGNVQVNVINDKSFEEDIASRAIWLNRPNHIANRVIFTDSISITGDLTIGASLNNRNIDELINDIVWKDSAKNYNKTNQISIKAQKKFVHPFEIDNNAEILYLNEGLTQNLGKTNTNCNFQGDLHIFGNLEVSNFHIGKYFNDVEVEIFTNLCRYDADLKSFVIGQKVYFKGQTTIGNLHLMGRLNDLWNCSDFMDNLVFKNESSLISSAIVFQKPIELKTESFIEIFNGRNISKAFEDIAFDDEKDFLEVNGPIAFREPVKVEDALEVEKELHTSNLGGCDIYEWKMNSLLINQDVNISKLYFMSGALDSNDLDVKHLNEYDLLELITLNTPQNISGDIHLPKLFLTGSLQSQNQINGEFDLEAEMKNTVMKNKPNQRITSPITAKSFTVLGDLHINSLVNEKKNISDVAHFLSETLELHTPVFFKNLTVSEVYTKDFISGFNFNEWYNQSLWSNGRPIQKVSGNWEIENLYVKERIFGSHNVNDIPLEMIRAQLDGFSEDQQKEFKYMADSYNVVCQKVKKIIKKAQKRVYFVKYFEKFIKYSEFGLINSINVFEYSGLNYLLVNVDCQTNIYQWDEVNSRFIKRNSFESGSVIEYVPISDLSGHLSLVTNSKINELKNCKNHGVFTWVLKGGNISKNDHFYGDFDSIHYDSKNYGIIYGIPMNQNTVVEMNLLQGSNDAKNQRIWELPNESKGLYRFLPDDTEFGTAVSDGKRILVINKNFKSQTRKRRDTSSQKMADNIQSKTNVTAGILKVDLGEVLQNLILNISDNLQILNENSNETKKIESEIFEDVHNSEYNQILLEIDKIKNSEDFNISSLTIPKTNNTFINTKRFVALNTTKSAWNFLKKIDNITNLFNAHIKISEHLLTHQKNGYLETFKVFNKKLRSGIISGVFNIANIMKNLTLKTNNKLNLNSLESNLQLKQAISNVQSFLLNRLEYLKPSNNSYILSANSSQIDAILKVSNISQIGVQYTPTSTAPNISQIHLNTTNPIFNRKLLGEYFREPIIGQAMSSSSSSARNLLIADNVHIPNKLSGEVLAIKVSYAENQRTLFAITNSNQYNYRTGSIHDHFQGSIKIFFDVMQGHVFQTIQAHNPRNLVSLNIRDETVLGFVEGKNILKFYIYRGIQGFVEFAQTQVEHKIDKLLSVTLPKKYNEKNSVCPEFYFIAAGENYFTFYKAIIAGTCAVNGDLSCGNWV